MQTRPFPGTLEWSKLASKTVGVPISEQTGPISRTPTTTTSKSGKKYVSSGGVLEGMTSFSCDYHPSRTSPDSTPIRPLRKSCKTCWQRSKFVGGRYHVMRVPLPGVAVRSGARTGRGSRRSDIPVEFASFPGPSATSSMVGKSAAFAGSESSRGENEELPEARRRARAAERTATSGGSS